MISTVDDAFNLLKSLGATQQLVHHARLVGEAADELIDLLNSLDVEFNADFIRIGVVIHDAGKIIHPRELIEKGCEHETAGERLLLENDVQPEIARCCISHARYDSMKVSFEELLVALSDKIWKGKRVDNLELRVVDHVANALNKNRWEIFEDLDSCFERIASQGDQRLARSRSL